MTPSVDRTHVVKHRFLSSRARARRMSLDECRFHTTDGVLGVVVDEPPAVWLIARAGKVDCNDIVV